MDREALNRAVEAIAPRFRSGNHIPVDKAQVPAEEWNSLLEALASAPAANQEAWTHKKSGGQYRLIGKALIQSDAPLPDLSPVVVYQGEDGALWARAASEFRARFNPTTAATSEYAAPARAEPDVRNRMSEAQPAMDLVRQVRAGPYGAWIEVEEREAAKWVAAGWQMRTLAVVPSPITDKGEGNADPQAAPRG